MLRQLISTVEDARANCKLLSLISSAKMKILHRNIISECFVVDTFIDDLGMFFNRDFSERVCEEMKVSIEVSKHV